MTLYWKTVWVLFGIFVVANAAYLGSVPGLMGDEASEGENAWELLRSDHLVIQGERSYIGPLIDYVRVPFIKAFGYTALSLRLVVFLASLAAFWLAASVLRNLFDETPALFALVFGFFNPIYLTQARLGWAITLFPFFAFLMLFLLTSQFKHRALLTGLAAGVGLSNHILFLPTLVAIVVAGIVVGVLPANSAGSSPGFLSRLKGVLAYWPGLVGFAAGFALQFWVLLTFREDQGDVAAVAQSFWERVRDLPKVLPLAISGSSYVARYTGIEFTSNAIWIITAVVTLLGIIALLLSKQRKIAWMWILGMIVHLIVLLYMIDRFTLRYFVMFVLGAWMLAGVGLGVLLELASSHMKSWLHYDLRNSTLSSPAPRAKSPRFMWLRSLNQILVALLLVLWSMFAILIPFLRTGGSTNNFSLGNRTDSAAALVDTQPLVTCLRGAGPVSSENIHIWNRLQFLSHKYSDLEIKAQEETVHAPWLVHYRDEEQSGPGDLCPELAHFRVVAN